jgi:hypothetical protein
MRYGPYGLHGRSKIYRISQAPLQQLESGSSQRAAASAIHTRLCHPCITIVRPCDVLQSHLLIHVRFLTVHDKLLPHFDGSRELK